MAGVNKVILVGNLGKDPEVRYTPGGQAVANFTIATNENWTDKQGQKQERTEWHSVVLWGKPAEIVKQFVTKGQKLYIEGRLQTRSWDDKDGKKRYMTEIVAQDFMFLSGRGEGAGAAGGGEWSGGGGGGARRGGGGGAPAGGGGFGGGDPPPADDYNQAPRGGGPGDDDIPF